MKKLMLFAFLMLFSNALVGQDMTMADGTTMFSLVGNQYRMSENYWFTDNQTNCQTYNCLSLTNVGSGGGTVSFVQISSGFDGSVYAIDGAGNIWNLPFATTSKALWTKVTAFGAGLKGIAVRSSTEIYALYSNPTACSTSSGTFAIARWNGSAWAYLQTGCAFTLSITSDDNLVVIGSDRALYFATDPTPASPNWVRVSAPAGGWGNAVGIDDNLAFANSGTQLYSVNLGNGYLSVVSGAPAISNTAYNMAASSDGWLYLRSSTSTSKGNFYAYPFEQASPTWLNLKGTVTILGGNIRDGLFAQYGSTLYHYLNTAVAHTSTVSGYYDCGSSGGCPAGAVHTATASGRFLHGTNPNGSVSQSGAPSATLTANYNDISEACDPLFGDPTSQECVISQTQTTINNQVTCSVMGLIYSAALQVPKLLDWEIAHTRALYSGVRTGCITGKSGLTWCDYSVNNWCSNTSTPDLDMNGKFVHESASTAYSYWDLQAFCINTLGTGWECSHAFGPGYSGQAPQAVCTTH